MTLDPDEAEFFKTVAGGRLGPVAPLREVWAIAGRRSGKSRMAAACAVFEACLNVRMLACGETGMVLVLAPTMAQASIVFAYALGFIEASPLLRQQLLSSTSTEIRLAGDVVIAVHPANYRSVRGRTLLAVIADEIAYWRSDDDQSANPDRYGQSFGVDDPDVLVIQAPSLALNPTLSQATIDRAHADDAESASSEWDAQFRTDLSAFLSDDLIDSAIDRARPREIPPVSGRSYVAFVDPSGGRADAYTLCIGHKEKDGRFVCDLIRRVAPPFDPQSVTASFANLCREYRLTKIVSDNYAGEWVSSAWREQGFTHDRSEMPASALYLEALASFARGSISIPDNPQLIRELRQLERRTSRTGRDTVSHPPDGHDDHANALCGALRLAVKPLSLGQCGSYIDAEAGAVPYGWRRPPRFTVVVGGMSSG